MVAAAQSYQATADFANPLSTVKLSAQLQTLASKVATLLASNPKPTDVPSALDGLVRTIFSLTPVQVMANADFKSSWTRIADSIVALFISPAAGRDLLEPLTTLLRAIDLIRRVSLSDASLATAGALADALSRTLLLPAPIFPLNPGLVKPAGIADLLVVRQHLTRYELSDISSIENVLQGESKKHSTRHTLTNETEITTENEQTTVTEEEAQVDERFELKRESNSVIQQDLSVKAGVNASYKYGDTLSINANADVSHETAQSDSVKSSSDYAKDVTSRAASKITERVFRSETQKVTETFDAADSHEFAATRKSNSIGIYQFLTKVYTAQVFNYGKRLLFDISVPEPAAFYIDAVATPAPDTAPLVEPDAFTLSPSELEYVNRNSDQYYQKFMAKYQVTGFTAPPPPEQVIVSHTFSRKVDFHADPPDKILDGGEIAIPPGYHVKRIALNGGFHWGKGVSDDTTGVDSGWVVSVGPFTFQVFAPGKLTLRGLDTNFGTRVSSAGDTPVIVDVTTSKYQEASSIPWSVTTIIAVDVSVAIELTCELSPEAREAWRLKVHAAIVQAYRQQLSDYRDQLQQQQFAAQSTFGTNPDANRAIERAELKRSAVSILSGRDLVDSPQGAIIDKADNIPPHLDRHYPRPDLATAEKQGSFVRFFEQAFEWEQMTYLFYPYHWSRPSTWFDKVLLSNDDPTFADFLRAGEARVVVPVRPGFENDVWYYLTTGQIWGGGDMPNITDSDYLPITEEIRSATGAPGTETPQGDSWEIRLPTELVRTRDDSSLPTWTKTAEPWTFTGN